MMGVEQMVPVRRCCALLALGMVVTCAVSPSEGGLPWFKRGEPKTGSKAWWDLRAAQPPGVRQREKFGKVWPPQARPVGPRQTFIHQYHDTHYWPFPYSEEDRNYVRAATDQFVSAGWVEATTLYDYHFENSNKLNRAGQMRLRWIMQGVPSRHRYVYVQSSLTSEANQSRMENVRADAMEMTAGSGNIPPIMQRVASPLGRPAVEIEQIRKLDMESTISPRISPPITGEQGGYGPGS